MNIKHFPDSSIFYYRIILEQWVLKLRRSPGWKTIGSVLFFWWFPFSWKLFISSSPLSIPAWTRCSSPSREWGLTLLILNRSCRWWSTYLSSNSLFSGESHFSFTDSSGSKQLQKTHEEQPFNSPRYCFLSCLSTWLCSWCLFPTFSESLPMSFCQHGGPGSSWFLPSPSVCFMRSLNSATGLMENWISRFSTSQRSCPTFSSMWWCNSPVWTTMESIPSTSSASGSASASAWWGRWWKKAEILWRVHRFLDGSQNTTITWDTNRSFACKEELEKEWFCI